MNAKACIIFTRERKRNRNQKILATWLPWPWSEPYDRPHVFDNYHEAAAFADPMADRGLAVKIEPAPRDAP